MAGALCAAAMAAVLLAPRVACAQQGAAPAPQSQATEPPASVVPQGTPQSQPGGLPPILVTPNPPRARAAAKTRRRPAGAAALPAPPAQATAAPQAEGAAELVGISPVAGSDLPVGKFPGSVSTATAAELTRSGGTSVQQMLDASVPGITVSDLQGNDFQVGVQYRGFSASPVDGVPQGLAVYQNGVRINEVFGDTVNWDFLPAVAVKSITVMSNNPVFGLNAIGGAANIAMKDGFAFQGVEADVRLGSFGDRRGALQAGSQSGPWAAYVALEDIHDDGFRAEGASDIRRAYGDLAARGDGNELHLSITAADNLYGVAAASPVQLLDQGWGRVFTIPQTTENRMEMLAANATVAASDTLKFSGVVYYRHFSQ